MSVPVLVQSAASEQLSLLYEELHGISESLPCSRPGLPSRDLVPASRA